MRGGTVDEVRNLELEYAKSQPRNVSVVAAITLIIPIVPLIGYVLGITSVFVIGGLATPFALIGATIGLVTSRRKANTPLWVISVILNGLEAVYFVNLIVNVWDVCP